MGEERKSDGQPERIMPDRAGWWWRMGNHGPVANFLSAVDGLQAALRAERNGAA